ncbi:MAG: hypothetical protein CSA62_12705 [Planctomycetota bacterium]|nr:MAG: hypothetical protein CSA62_12705 [Planctomycetota bacterium]
MAPGEKASPINTTRDREKEEDCAALLQQHPLGVLTEEFGAYSTVFVRRQLEALAPLSPFVACWVRSNASVFDFEPVHIIRSKRFVDRVRAKLFGFLPKRFGHHERVLAEPSLRRLLQSYKPRHLLIHFGWSAVRVLQVLEAERLSFSLFLHGSDLNEAYAHPRHPYARRLRRAASLAHRCFVVSKDLANKCKAIGVPESQVEVFYLGVPVPEDIATPRPERNGGRILANGRLIEWKGHRVLLEALARLAQAGLRPRLSLIGEGELMPKLQAQAQSLGIEKQVEFCGHRSNSEVYKLLLSSDIFAHPSLRLPTGEEEGLGLAVQEAMAAGLPVVGTKTGGIPDSILDGETGFLVAPDNADAMANRLAQLLKDGSLCRRLGSAARTRVEKHFNLEHRNALLLAQMQKLVGE